VSRYRKNLTVMEKLYLCFNELRPPFCNQLVVEGVGRVDEGAIRRALRRSSRVNPGASLKTVGFLGRMRWVGGPAPRLTLVKGSTWDGFTEQNGPFLHSTLDPESGPTCELQYVEAHHKTFFVFRSLHAVMDGVGHRAWAQDFFLALRGEQPEGHPDVVCSSEAARSLTRERMEFPRPDALHPCGLADGITSGNDYQWRRVTIQRPRSSALLADVAIRLGEEARRQGQGPVRVSIPVDFRYFFPQVRTTANLIGPLFVDIVPSQTRASFLAGMKESLKRREHARRPRGYDAFSWLPLPLLAMMLKGAFAREHAKGRYAISATISDVGNFTARQCSTDEFAADAAFFVPPFADQHCFVTLNGFEDRTYVVLSMPSVFCSRGRLDRLMESLTEAITEGAP
jgi:hypothetical protein